jgi:transcription antitermination factor NusG
MEPGSGVPRALFPGYLFVRPLDRWRKLRSTYGVIDIVSRGDQPEYVPKAVMTALRRNADKQGIVTLPKQRKPEMGEAVEIKIGAWQGFKGLYDGLDDQGRIQVLLSMFGRNVVLKFKRQSSIQVVNA